MRNLLAFAFAAALAASSAPAFAQAAGGAMPSCPANDPVVWLNTSSNVYHVKGDKYFGNTKAGKYLCQSQATAAGGRQSKEGSRSTGTTSAGTTSGATAGAAATPTPRKHFMFGNGATPAPGNAAGTPATAAPGAMATKAPKHHHHSTPSPAAGAPATAAPGAMETKAPKHHHHSTPSPAAGATAAPSPSK